MKVSEVRSKSVDELKEALLHLRRERLNYRFQAASGILENTAQIRRARRDIARIKTILNERESSRNQDGEK